MGLTPRPAPEGAAIGAVLLGKYRVDAVLGQGGMGIVAKCTHLGLGEHVAIKMLRQDVMLDRDATERFMREAQSASRLKSEHVARVVDVGTFPDNHVPYMIMEFLDGHDLGDLVDERGPLQPPFASMLMLQAAEALAEAHAIGIVHRDVKPSNLFVTWRPDGSALVKVLDFGISKSPMGTDLKLTQTQSLLGTPAYMSPEQMRSARLVDSRTDIWSLGTVFYELLEGRRPFEAESFSEMCVKVAVDPPEQMVNTPPALQQIILRCLAKNPDQRYATMAELGRDLLPHVQDVHQASLLVERMQRILGRSRPSAPNAEQNWETGPGTGVSRAPIPVRDHASAPVVAWHGGSDPLAQSIPTPHPFARALTPDPRAPDHTLREESKPAAAISEVFAVPAKQKRKTWLALLAVFAVIGIAVGAIVAAQTDDAPARDTEVTVTPGLDPVAKPPEKPPEKPPTAIAKEGSAQPQDTGSAQQDTGSAAGSNTITAIKPDEAKPPADGELPKNAGSAAQKPTGKVAGKPNPQVTKNPQVGVRKTPDKPPVQKSPGIKVGNEVMNPGEGSAKTVPPEGTTPAGPPKCPISDRLPSGKWPARCPQSKSQPKSP